jgi:hypothetical protein
MSFGATKRFACRFVPWEPIDFFAKGVMVCAFTPAYREHFPQTLMGRFGAQR